MYSFSSTPINSISAAARLTLEGKTETFLIAPFIIQSPIEHSPKINS